MTDAVDALCVGEEARLFVADQVVVFPVETYQGARHGWAPTDSRVHNHEAAERHWSSLIDLCNRTLKRTTH